MKFETTKNVAKMLGVRPSLIHSAVFNNRIESPPKSPSGRYAWSEEDIEKAKAILTGQKTNEQ